MVINFKRTFLIFALFTLCVTTATHKALAQESSIEVNLDILDAAPEEEEEIKLVKPADPLDILQNDVDKIAAEAKAKVEAAIDAKKHILKPRAAKKSYAPVKPSSTYSSGSYVSPYKSIYDDPYSYKRKKYSPPKPTVNTYEAYLEKYRKHSKDYKPYLSDEWKKPRSYKSTYTKKPTPKPYVADTKYKAPEATAPIAAPVVPVQVTKPKVSIAPVVQAAPVKPKRTFKPLEDYKVPDTTEIATPKLDAVERENVKQNIFKSMDSINKIEPPKKRHDLAIKAPAPVATPTMPDASLLATPTEQNVPSIFDNKIVTPEPETTMVKELASDKQFLPEQNIILDKNIEIKDSSITDITKAPRIAISKENEAVADTDITDKVITADKEAPSELNLPSKVVATNATTKKVAKKYIDDTNQYTNRKPAKQVKTAKKAPTKIKEVTKTISKSEPKAKVREITKPNIYAQKAQESMGLIADKFENISAAPKAKVATKLAKASTETTIQKAQSVLKDIGRNVEEITEKAAEATKRTTNNVKNSITKELKKKKIIELEPKETLVSLKFAADESALSDALKEELDSTAAFLKQSPNIRVQIRAFAQSANKTKSDARRMSLSRGLIVRSYLTEKGIKPVRLDIRALGDNTEETPLDRVDIVFLD